MSIANMNLHGKLPQLAISKNGDMITPADDGSITDAVWEGTFSASRHAHANLIQVRLIRKVLPELAQTLLTLSIKDVGVGFDDAVVQDGIVKI